MKRRDFLKGLAATLVLSSTFFPESIFREDSLDVKGSRARSAFVWDESYSCDWDSQFPYNLVTGGHVFPLRKYEGVYNGLGDQKMIPAQELSRKDFERVHTSEYLDSLEKLSSSYLGLLNGETPTSPEILRMVKAACGGSLSAGEYALDHGKAMNLCGGYHHAFADHEEGFCLLNDVAIAIRNLQSREKVRKALIIDLDVHHGNGNASIFREDNSVDIYDLYDSDNYPEEKIPVRFDQRMSSGDYVDDVSYLERLGSTLPDALDSSDPDLVFYIAGADPFTEDKLGGFLVSKEGLLSRDEFVVQEITKRGIPLAVVMGGGYPENIEDVIEIQTNTARCLIK